MRTILNNSSVFRRGGKPRRLLAAVLSLALVCTGIGIGSAFADNSETCLQVTAYNGLESYPVGAVPDCATIGDLGWRPGTTAAKVTLERGSDAVGFTKSMTVHSDVAEGQGPYNATPMFGTELNVPVRAANHAVMFYIKTPQIGAESKDAWPVEWSVRINSIRIRQESTDKSELWATLANANIRYLGSHSSKWTAAKLDGNGTMVLPSGFEGYVRVYLNGADNWKSWQRKGFNASADYTLDYMQMVFGWLGGEYGDFVLGGIYTVENDVDSLKLKLGDSEPVSLAEESDFMEGTSHFNFMDEAGTQVPSAVMSVSDAGFRTGTTQALCVYGDPIVPLSNMSSVRLRSAVAEGQGPNFATPNVTLWTYVPVNAATGCVMLSVQTPQIGDGDVKWPFRIASLSCQQNGVNDWFFSTFNNSKISYLSSDGKEWIDTVTDENGSVMLPGGFRGYLKLYLNTCNNYQQWSITNGFNASENFQLNAIQFHFGWLGGDYGDFAIGGVYSITNDKKSTEMLVDGKSLKKLTVEEDCFIAKSRYDLSGSELGAKVDFAECLEHDGWRPGKSQMTATYGEPSAPIGNNRSVRFTSPAAEGEGPYNAAPYAQIATWMKVSAACNAVMLYVEVPTYPTDAEVVYALRLSSMAVQQDGITDWLWSEYNDAMFEYLAADGNRWVKSRTDTYGTLGLPNGFKGYIKLYVDACPGYLRWISNNHFDSTKDYQLNYLIFDFGWIGGTAGDFVIGDFYEITRDSETAMIRLNGGEPQNMTLYANESEKAVKEFNTLMEEIGEITADDIPVVNRAEEIMSFLANDYRDQLDTKAVKTYHAARSSIAVYRPKMLGASVLAENPSPQKMKLGATVDLSSAKKDGYTVTGYGIVTVPASLYDKTKSLTVNMTGAKQLTVKADSETASALSFSGVYAYASTADYGLKMLARPYVIYHNDMTGVEFYAYAGDYTFEDGTVGENFAVNVTDVMRYYGLTLYGGNG